VLVSNFVTPAWFEPAFADRLDFKRHLTRELELHAGGHVSIFDSRRGWTQITANGEGGPSIVPGSRRQLRKMWRRLRRKANNSFSPRLLPPPTNAVFGLLDENAVGGEFGADCVRSREVAGFAGGTHLLDLGVNLLIGESG